MQPVILVYVSASTHIQLPISFNNLVSSCRNKDFAFERCNCIQSALLKIYQHQKITHSSCSTLLQPFHSAQSLWLRVSDTKLLHNKIEVSSTCGMTYLKKGQDHHHKIYDASGKKQLMIQKKRSLGTLVIFVINYCQWHPPAHHCLQCINSISLPI